MDKQNFPRRRTITINVDALPTHLREAWEHAETVRLAAQNARDDFFGRFTDALDRA